MSVGAPDVFENPPGGKRFVAMAREQVKEPELLVGEPQCTLATHRVTLLYVQDYGSKTDAVGGVVERLAVFARASQLRPDARHEFPRVERLGEIVVGADTQANDQIVHGAAGRKHEDWHAVMGADL